MFLGLVGGLFVAKLFGLPETSLIAIGMGAMTVAMLRLPLSSVILAMVVTQAGLQAAPVIIVAVVVAYIVTEILGARRQAPTPAGSGADPAPAAAARPPDPGRRGRRGQLGGGPPRPPPRWVRSDDLDRRIAASSSRSATATSTTKPTSCAIS